MTGAESSSRKQSARGLHPGVVMLFWAGVLIILGHLFHYQPSPAFLIAPHGQLGKVVLLVAGAFVYGSLRDTRLCRTALVLAVLCALPAGLMAAQWAAFVLRVSGNWWGLSEASPRAASFGLGLESAALAALIVMLREAGLLPRAAFRLWLFFFAGLAAAALAVPVALAEPFWQRAASWTERAAGWQLFGAKAGVAALCFAVLPRARRLPQAEIIHPLSGPDR